MIEILIQRPMQTHPDLERQRARTTEEADEWSPAHKASIITRTHASLCSIPKILGCVWRPLFAQNQSLSQPGAMVLHRQGRQADGSRRWADS